MTSTLCIVGTWSVRPSRIEDRGIEDDNEHEHEDDWLGMMHHRAWALVLSTGLRRRSLDILEVNTALL
jgi:hypothetical protein